ncbi:DUF1697 domain-containing protein [Massilia yuzhufengensis]|uniref:Uncharacterized conserved protein, DUF1697 family n=1 Tax=Massilia yuzhufengensis TaxID=1164594 RepID=A0A1I1U5B9_9BURK|nr:DUF1697 domain-containing protein [Massilia yuzhufengensis]SFD63903.1 Uncharacterized conserved protein, DUF1697 family [Massilia yuzhufengensis]
MNKRCYVALVRGINVGRAKRIAMADLRALVESLGYSGVRSLLNSGNVVFQAAGTTAPAAAAAIEEALVLKLGVAARVFVLEHGELAAVIAANPLLGVALDHSRLIVFFLGEAAQRAQLAALDGQDWGCERLALGERAAYVWCPEGMLDSAPAKALGKLLGDGTTSRNWSTLMKLHALCSEG